MRGNFFVDKTGRVVLYQTPNNTLIAWFLLRVTSLLLPMDSAAKSQFLMASSFFLVVWGVCELLGGVNYFRRILGAVVICFVVAPAIYGLFT